MLILSYCCILRELVDKPFIISYFLSTFCPTLGHHQGRMYHKSDVTFVRTLLLCKNKRLYWCIVLRLLFEFVSINSVSSERHLSTLALVLKLILLSLGCIFLIYSASRICSFRLLFCFSNIMFSVRIFRNSVAGPECFFRCYAVELVSERCIISLLDRVVEVEPTYILLFIVIKSHKGHLNRYITLVFYNTPIEGEQLFLSWRF